MDSPKLVYLSAPYGGSQANLERAKRWLRWAWVNHDDLAFMAPWITNAEVLNEFHAMFRERGLATDLEVVGMCDSIWLCGGKLTPGMADELKAAERLGLEVENLIPLGDEPPEGEWTGVQ